MSNFDRLHPAIQHHIVNALGWRNLRPFQDELIPSILEGNDHIIIAPTAGGKTEAVIFPLLSRMASEDWHGLTVLYVCPLRALLNNLYERVSQYCGFIGRSAGIWHGDVLASEKNAILREPPDVLMTTPESLEGILISPNKDHRSLLSNVRVIVIDEIHAFAGDDRGWHLLFVLQRILNFSQHQKIQRLGLSATVGNPAYLMDWLSAGAPSKSQIYLPIEPPSDKADVKVDFVGSLANAATIISRLHHGEKRLVFFDSRAKAEELGKQLRELEVDVYVTHGSLSREQRMISEQAFAERTDCVIVATGVLELGIDIGSLDRVIQIESPNDVAGFLQRMGRTGRRPGTRRNCLFLTTKPDKLLKTCALIELWKDGFVEPALPPERPMHIAGQQMMALSLQNNGVGREQLLRQLATPLTFGGVSTQELENILDWMLTEEILFDDSGIMSMGRAGEDEFGRRHFIDLVSVFCTPPLFTVRHGRQDVGYVDPLTFSQKKEEPWNILLAGKSWKVNNVDWKRKLAYVEPVRAEGKSRWFGLGPSMSYELCQAYKKVLTGSFERDWWSNRASESVGQVRQEFYWVPPDETILTYGEANRIEWWTFAGTKGNATLAAGLSRQLKTEVKPNPFHLRIESQHKLEDVHSAIESLRSQDPAEWQPAVNENAMRGLKFNACLSEKNSRSILQARLKDAKVAQLVLNEDVKLMVMPN